MKTHAHSNMNSNKIAYIKTASSSLFIAFDVVVISVLANEQLRKQAQGLLCSQLGSEGKGKREITEREGRSKGKGEGGEKYGEQLFPSRSSSRVAWPSHYTPTTLRTLEKEESIPRHYWDCPL